MAIDSNKVYCVTVPSARRTRNAAHVSKAGTIRFYQPTLLSSFLQIARTINYPPQTKFYLME